MIKSLSPRSVEVGRGDATVQHFIMSTRNQACKHARTQTCSHARAHFFLNTLVSGYIIMSQLRVRQEFMPRMILYQTAIFFKLELYVSSINMLTAVPLEFLRDNGTQSAAGRSKVNLHIINLIICHMWQAVALSYVERIYISWPFLIQNVRSVLLDYCGGRCLDQSTALFYCLHVWPLIRLR